MSGIQFIRRDWADQVCLIRMIANDTLATVAGAGYITAQAANIAAFNEGPFEWQVGDMVLAYCTDGWGFFTIASPYASLVAFAFAPSVATPVVVGDFAIFSSTGGNLEDLGYLPSNAAKTRVVMAGSAVVANHIALFQDTTGTIDDTAATAINSGSIQAGLSGTAGTLISYPAVAANGQMIVAAVGNAGNFNTTLSSISTLGQSSVYTLPDPGAGTANILISSNAAGQSVASASASATPGSVRALKGLMTLSNATYANTTNSVAGVRGEVDMVGASSGYVYGVQGKVIPTGTLSGSIWAPAVFGQYDLSAATLNAGQIAAIWGDMGATGGTFTDVTGARMFAGTNTIASLTLNSMIYLYGKATSLLELSGSSSTYISTGAATPSGDLKKIAITIDGVVHYILAAAVWS